MKRTKSMKLPNGFGQITFLKQRLRNPYRVMITVGVNEEGRPICKILKPKGYFKTYNEAYSALVEHHKNPYDLRLETTLKQIYEEWSNIKYDTAKQSSINQYKLGWKYLSKIHDYKMIDIKPKLIRQIIDENRKIATAPKLIRGLLNFLFDYALENEIVEKNYSREMKINVTPETKNHHISFKDEEITKLWSYSNRDIVKMILIQCYTGLRPGELCELKRDNINLDENIIIGGFKTKAGTNRRIPIHPIIKSFINDFMKFSSGKNSEFLFTNSYNNNKFDTRTYSNKYQSIMAELDLDPNHKAHDPRKFFITQAKKCHVDEYAIKLIVGHTIKDLTERVYTEREFNWLYDEICKIEVPTPFVQL